MSILTIFVTLTDEIELWALRGKMNSFLGINVIHNLGMFTKSVQFSSGSKILTYILCHGQFVVIANAKLSNNNEVFTSVAL